MPKLPPELQAGLISLLVGYLLLAISWLSSKRPHTRGGVTPDHDMAAGLMMLGLGLLGCGLAILKWLDGRKHHG